MPVPERTIMEVIYRYTVNNQICMTVLHYTNQVASDGATPIAATQEFLVKAAAIENNPILGNISALQAINVTYLDCSVQCIYPQRFIKLRQDVARTGQDPGTCTAQNLAAVVTKLGDHGARNNVGSLHVGGLPVTAYTGGLLTAGAMVKMNFITSAVLASYTDEINVLTWDPCLANRTKVIVGGKDHYVISGSTLLYTAVPQHEVRTMRRRTVGLGI